MSTPLMQSIGLLLITAILFLHVCYMRMSVDRITEGIEQAKDIITSTTWCGGPQ